MGDMLGKTNWDTILLTKPLGWKKIKETDHILFFEDRGIRAHHPYMHTLVFPLQYFETSDRLIAP